MNKRNPYDLLGVSQDASLEDIHSAYKNRVKVLHPDRFDQESQPSEWQIANEMLRELNEAYAQLRQNLNPQKTEVPTSSSENQDLGPDKFAFSEDMDPELKEMLARFRYMNQPEVKKRFEESLRWYYFPLKFGLLLIVAGIGIFVLLCWTVDTSQLPQGEWCWQKVIFWSDLGLTGIGLLFILGWFNGSFGE